MLKLVSTIGLVFAGAVVCVEAQWFNHRDPSIPRTANGRPNLTASAPRLNGKPDVSGVWHAERTPLDEWIRGVGPGLPQIQPDLNDVTKHVLNIFWGVKPEDEPLRPEAVALMRQRRASGEDYQPMYCLPTSLPGSALVLAFKMIQARSEIVVIPGTGDPPRQIYTDGRSLPKDPDPSWTGHSVGRWEGDTLVVDTVGIHTRAWVDGFGHPRSEGMRITERYRRRDFGHAELEVTLDDPKYYTRPFGFKTTLTLLPDTDVLEYVCNENEKDRTHYRQ